MDVLRRGFAGISELLFLSILVVGLAASTILTQQEQRPQPQAALACRYCSNGSCRNRNPPCSHSLDRCFENADCPAPTPRPPTSTPRPPTSTPPPPNPTPRCPGTCYQGYACPPGYNENDGCPAGYTCCTVMPTLTPTPNPPTPTPTYISVHCLPGDTRCVDPPPGSGNNPIFQTCNPLGNGWNNQTCLLPQMCNWNHTLCVYPVYLTPTPECSSNQTMCQDQMKYGCVGGEWMPYINPGNCLTATPTPPPPTPTLPPNLINCPVQHGWALCSQTNPLWANTYLPYCLDDNGNYIPDPYTISQRGCGEAATCSLLCTCKHTAQYCNLDQCISAINRYQSVNCRGTGVDLNVLVLQSFPECFKATYTAIPDDISNPDVHLVSWAKIDQELAFGPVEIQGTFTLKSTGESFSHNSIIVGKDAYGRIYNDPYFNSQNPIPKYQISSSYLEDFFDITLVGAISVK